MPAWAQLPQSGKMKKICFLRRAWRLAPHVIRGALSLSIRNSSSFERIEYATVSVYVLHRQPSPSPLCSSFGNQLGIPTAFCSNPSNPPRVSSLNYVRPPANRLELREFSPLASGNLAICFHTRAPRLAPFFFPSLSSSPLPEKGDPWSPRRGQTSSLPSSVLRPIRTPITKPIQRDFIARRTARGTVEFPGQHQTGNHLRLSYKNPLAKRGVPLPWWVN